MDELAARLLQVWVLVGGLTLSAEPFQQRSQPLVTLAAQTCNLIHEILARWRAVTGSEGSPSRPQALLGSSDAVAGILPLFSKIVRAFCHGQRC
jgi:hypothetical protein